MINGNLKSLELLWLGLASNQRYRQFVSEKDILSFKRRVENEGLPFLTKSLPLLGKALDRYHSIGEWIPPDGFTIRETIPVFLQDAILPSLKGDSYAVDCVRQLSYIFYKLETPYEQQTVREFLDSFIAIDNSLANFSAPNWSLKTVSVLKKARTLIARILSNWDPLEIRPKHGTGATACRTASWDKYHKLRYYPKLDETYSYADYFFYSFTHLSDEYEKLEQSKEMEPKARVCLVPKDSRGPRIISCEPAELMFIQQGIMRLLYRILESHFLTSGYINFSDQSINQSKAREGSINSQYATIDLKDASDRVSLSLVKELFPEPWVRCFTACRSDSTILPDGREVKLQKFAPMGSSCCFPVEALVFWALASASVKGRREIYVYGDDIICPPYMVGEIVDTFEAVGLQVNRDKCYTQGPFRESCGGDFHKGMDVTPLKLRKAIGSSPSHWVSSVEFLNNHIKKFGSVPSSIVNLVEDVTGPIPRSSLDLPMVIRESPGASNDVFFRRRWCKPYQRYEYLVPRLTFRSVKRRDASWSELLRKELDRGSSSMPFEDTLQQLRNEASGRLLPGEYADPHSVRIKWVWTWLG
jgi:hypothetical protein